MTLICLYRFVNLKQKSSFLFHHLHLLFSCYQENPQTGGNLFWFYFHQTFINVACNCPFNMFPFTLSLLLRQNTSQSLHHIITSQKPLVEFIYLFYSYISLHVPVFDPCLTESEQTLTLCQTQSELQQDSNAFFKNAASQDTTDNRTSPAPCCAPNNKTKTKHDLLYSCYSNYFIFFWQQISVVGANMAHKRGMRTSPLLYPKRTGFNKARNR